MATLTLILIVEEQLSSERNTPAAQLWNECEKSCCRFISDVDQFEAFLSEHPHLFKMDFHLRTIRKRSTTHRKVLRKLQLRMSARQFSVLVLGSWLGTVDPTFKKENYGKGNQWVFFLTMMIFLSP